MPFAARRAATRLPATPEPTMTTSADQGMGSGPALWSARPGAELARARRGRGHADRIPHERAFVRGEALFLVDLVDPRVPPLEDRALERDVGGRCALSARKVREEVAMLRH